LPARTAPAGGAEVGSTRPTCCAALHRTFWPAARWGDPSSLRRQADMYSVRYMSVLSDGPALRAERPQPAGPALRSAGRALHVKLAQQHVGAKIEQRVVHDVSAWRRRTSAARPGRRAARCVCAFCLPRGTASSGAQRQQSHAAGGGFALAGNFTVVAHQLRQAQRTDKRRKSRCTRGEEV